jgi:hypothetical protein
MNCFVCLPFLPLDVPVDLSGLVVLAGHLSSDGSSHLLLRSLALLLAKNSAARTAFHPEGTLLQCDLYLNSNVELNVDLNLI